MEPQLPPLTKTRVSIGSSSSSSMDPESVEIDPPINLGPNLESLKTEEVTQHEVIEIDVTDDLPDVMAIDEKAGSNYKGKTTSDFCGGPSNGKGKENMVNHDFAIATVENAGSSNVDPSNDLAINDDDMYNDMYDDALMDEDQYEMLQTQFDKFDVPSGVEAPLPWFSTMPPPNVDKVLHEMNLSLSMLSQELLPKKYDHEPESSQSKEKETAQIPKDSMNMNFVPWLPSPNHWDLLDPSDITPNVPSVFHNKIKFAKGNFGNEAMWNSIHKKSSSLNGASSSIDTTKPDMSWLSDDPDYMTEPFADFFLPHHAEESLPLPLDLGVDFNVDEVPEKFECFKQFDTVDDFSDHVYAHNNVLANQPQKNWAKEIQEQWRMLKKDLPDTILVRVYESRMDLLRAVIVGAEGTPYHDGLFFFDVLFPPGYPAEPPHVHYHSGGLHLNPNLYRCGKVCLSLLNTWSGSTNEMWMPGVSTMLQILVSIQALILNAKPFYNEPGYEIMFNTESGELEAEQYNEETLIKTLKSMLYTMRKPPKNFDDFVMGHFCKNAHNILTSCKAYMDGAQVGSLVKGQVQNVGENNKSCSARFKENVALLVDALAQSFIQIGAKDCEKFKNPNPIPNPNWNPNQKQKQQKLKKVKK